MSKDVTGIGLKNFRVFSQYSEFQFSPLTILTGPNNSGKSSLIKALLLLESYFNNQKEFLSEKIDFSATAPLLGTFDSIASSVKNKEITFSLPFSLDVDLMGNNDPNWLFELSFIRNVQKNEEIGILHRLKIIQPESKKILFEIEYTNQSHLMPDEQGYYDGKKVIVKSNIADIVNSVYNSLTSFENELKESADEIEMHYPYITHLGKNEYKGMMIQVDHNSYKAIDLKGKIVDFKFNPWDSFVPSHVPTEDFIYRPFIESVNHSTDKQSIILSPIKKSAIEFHESIKVSKNLGLLYKYKFSQAEKENTQRAHEIERVALSIVSKGQCSFEHDVDFINYLHEYDLFYKVAYKHHPNDSSQIERSFSFASQKEPEHIDFNFYILIYHEILYYLYKNNLRSIIDFDHEYYKKRYEANPEYFHFDEIDDELPLFDSIASFYSGLIITVVNHFKEQFKFKYLPSMRSKVRRVLHKEIDQTQLYQIVFDYNNESWETTPEYQFIRYWLNEFNLGEDLLIERKEATISMIYLVKDGVKRNIADLGFGISQFLPILLSIALNAKRKNDNEFHKNLFLSSTFLMEEPESNLHPKLQSKLADFFIDASSKFNIKFIIETHSEYLIRKLQYWIARKTIQSKDISLYYFNEREKNQKKSKGVTQINILEDGSLDKEFGEGFFDEATNWKFELLKLKNPQNN